MELVEVNCELIIRDEYLEDAGEITRFHNWKSTHLLNNVSQWQLEMSTTVFDSLDIDVFKNGIMFFRDGELLLSGPVTDIQHLLSAGEKKTNLFGSDDSIHLKNRICYPLVTGPVYNTLDKKWYFNVKRVGEGLWSLLQTACVAEDKTLTLINAYGFIAGAAITVINAGVVSTPAVTITAVNWATNVITLSGVIGLVLPVGCSIVQHTTAVVDDPDYLGYDTRKGNAETVAKELVYFNAGDGAVADEFGPRAIQFLHIASDLGRGTEVTSNARGEQLLEQVKDVCLAGGLNFEVKQVKQDLLFDVFIGDDLSKDDRLVFSHDIGNLKDYDYKYSAPTANMILGLGTGTGSARSVLPSAVQNSITQYGRIEGWVASQSSKTSEDVKEAAVSLAQTNNTYLAQAAYNAELTVSLQETDNTRFPRDFNVGDIVSVYIGTKKFSIPITAVDYTIPAGSGGVVGSAISAALMRKETNAMRQQKENTKSLRRLSMS